MGKVAAWRPVRRGKNDRALTRYKSHYGVNLLDPSPPTDFQPPGTMLGCRLWATSHANSDKVPTVSLSRFLSVRLSCLLSFFLSLSTPISRSRCLRCRHVPSSSLFIYSVPILLSFSLFPPVSLVLFGKLSPLAVSQRHPNPHGREPGNICPRDICVLIESPISSLIERTIGRSFSLSQSSLLSIPL